MIATRWEKQSVFINNSVKDDDHRLSPEFALSFREFHGELIVQLTYQLWFGGGCQLNNTFLILISALFQGFQDVDTEFDFDLLVQLCRNDPKDTQGLKRSENRGVV